MLNIEAETIASSVDETVSPLLSPPQIVEELSVRKAYSVAASLQEWEQGAIVIGSDTIVTLNKEVFGKPTDREDARRMLEQLQGRTHVVYTGLACVTDDHVDLRSVLAEQELGEPGSFRVEERMNRQILVGHTENKVTIRSMSEEEITAYIATGEPMDKAGSYGIQGIGSVFVKRIDGDFYSVMGLPVHLLYQMLLKLGVSPFRKE